MSRSSKFKSPSNSQADLIEQFRLVTGAPARKAKEFLDRYQRVDLAIDSYYNESSSLPAAPKRDSNKLNELFDHYKSCDDDDITVDGTIKLCEDLNVNPEDVVMLAVAYELKSPSVGRWTKKGWHDGWKNLGCDSIASMNLALPQLRHKLGSDPVYFQRVYNHTFDFARAEGQRGLAIDTAQAFWNLLLPHGLRNGALSHVPSGEEDEEEEGWREEYTEWWFDFLDKRGGKGVTRDTWVMFLEFIRTVNADFSNHDPEAAWPSTIDDFVEWAKNRFGSPSA